MLQRPVRRPRANAFVVLCFAVTACASTLSSGDVGTLRYGGRVKGVTPLALLPPVTDPTGNVYVMNGAPTIPETHVFVAVAGGGWNASCNLTKGDGFGAHGWAGFANDRQWYWSGAALVSVSGADGNCHAVLDHDPATNADLLFKAVMPSVRSLSERRSLVAIVQSPTDPLPFSALVDLDAEFLSNVQAFQPPDATDVQIIGVGGDRDRELAFSLVQYRQSSRAFLELRYFGRDGDFTSRTTVAGGPFAPYAVQGYLQRGDDGLVAGLVAVGDAAGTMNLLTIDDNGGDLVPVTVMQPVGVHRWQGALWLVGTNNDAPVVAPIGRGGVGPVSTWTASQTTAQAFGATTKIRDDRSLPSREVDWAKVRTATGAFPFLHPHSLVEHAPGTTLWVFAGPSTTDSALRLTAFAMAPVGVTYP